MSDLVESACELVIALDRVRAADHNWHNYAGVPSTEIAGELLDASEAVRVAVVALAGDHAAQATLAKVRALVADPHAGPFVAIDRILAALEPTDLPKGTKP